MSSNNVDVPRRGGVGGSSDGVEEDLCFQELWKVLGDWGASSEEEASEMTTQSHQNADPPGNRQHRTSLSLFIPAGDDNLMMFSAYVTRVVCRLCTQLLEI